MGIDAEMFAKVKRAVSEKEVIGLAYDLCEAFGSSHFFVDKDRKARALTLEDEIEQDGDTIEKEEGVSFIQVHLWTRYYGEDYERGDLPLILSIAKWLEYRLPGCEVWYGGDSSGVKHEWLTEERKEELWRHFCLVGSKPYRGNFGDESSTLNNDGMRNPFCDFCNHKMSRTGFGQNWAKYVCYGCGDSLETDKVTGELIKSKSD